jgi:formate hydrogenlyase subunit 3/multisubunit Na+/H+ antiporter MnhD subunit
LSALVLKASFFVIMRLWFCVFPYADLQLAGQLLAILGAGAILWGSVQAILQSHLKLMIAYSTVAQIGYLLLVFSLAADPATAWNAWSATVLFALSHAFGKAAAFMAAGSLLYATGRGDIDALAGTAEEQPASVFAFALSGVVLMGLPPSGAFFAKWLLLESALSSGHWLLAAVVLVGGVLAAIYVFRVIAKSLVSTKQESTRRVPLLMQYAPLVLAIVSVALGAMAYPTMRLLKVGAPFSAMSAEELP